jgi:hypothetical protein
MGHIGGAQFVFGIFEVETHGLDRAIEDFAYFPGSFVLPPNTSTYS